MNQAGLPLQSLNEESLLIEELGSGCIRCHKAFTQVQRWNKAKFCGEGCSNKHKEEQRKKKLGGQRIQVWACGGGVQSTAIAALIALGKLPKPELSWIVDVGWEKTATWKYVDDVLIPELKKAGITLNVLKTTDYKGNDVVVDGHATIPAYRQNGHKIKFDTRCSNAWKRQVAMKWLKENGVECCDTWLGISTDEIKRTRRSTIWWNQNRYPLVELGFDRGKCQWIVGKIGWPTPPRTSCFFCPNQNDAGWMELRRNWPEDFARACEIEGQIQRVQPDVYLHEFCQPLDTIKFRNEDKVETECFGSDRFCWSG